MWLGGPTAAGGDILLVRVASLTAALILAGYSLALVGHELWDMGDKATHPIPCMCGGILDQEADVSRFCLFTVGLLVVMTCHLCVTRTLLSC